MQLIAILMIFVSLLLPEFCLAASANAPAQPKTLPPQIAQQKLQACLKKADELPDIAAADAEAWFWHGGGDAARLCRDYAEFNANEFLPAAKGFMSLAHAREKANAKQTATLYAQAGLSYMRGEDMPNAELAYTKAVTLAPDSADILTDRAVCRIENERYWDAIDDLNKALKLQPNSVNALRQRGRAWTKLNNDKNADADFEHAAVLAGDLPAASPAPNNGPAPSVAPVKPKP